MIVDIAEYALWYLLVVLAILAIVGRAIWVLTPEDLDEDRITNWDKFLKDQSTQQERTFGTVIDYNQKRIEFFRHQEALHLSPPRRREVHMHEMP